LFEHEAFAPVHGILQVFKYASMNCSIGQVILTFDIGRLIFDISGMSRNRTAYQLFQRKKVAS